MLSGKLMIGTHVSTLWAKIEFFYLEFALFLEQELSRREVERGKLLHTSNTDVLRLFKWYHFALCIERPNNSPDTLQPVNSTSRRKLNTPVIPAVWLKKDSKFEDSLATLVTLCIKIKIKDPGNIAQWHSNAWQT